MYTDQNFQQTNVNQSFNPNYQGQSMNQQSYNQQYAQGFQNPSMNNNQVYGQNYQQSGMNQPVYDQPYIQNNQQQFYNQGYQQPMTNQQYGQTYGQTYQQPYMNQPQGFNNYNPQMMQYGQGNMPFTKEAMCKLPQFKNANASTMAGAIIAYISAVVTLILIIAEEMDPVSLIDVIIVALLGVIIHRTKSFGPSVVLLVYGIVSCIVTTLTMGALSGWLLIIGGIAAVIGSNKISKAWKNYERTGMIPAMPV